jgi:hypothetical protein
MDGDRSVVGRTELIPFLDIDPIPSPAWSRSLGFHDACQSEDLRSLSVAAVSAGGDEALDEEKT